MTLKEIKDLSDEKLNIKIAELAGWAFKFDSNRKEGTVIDPTGFGEIFHPPEYAHKVFLTKIPDYCHDLNAMHEAQKLLRDDRRNDFRAAIEQLTWDVRRGATADHLLFVTARQRAEAFVLTMEKDQPSKP